MKIGIIRFALLAGLCAGGVAGFTSCQPPKPEAVVEPEPLPPATPSPVATPPPAPAIAATTPVPDPLAPPGVFYLLQKTSITTEDGIVGLKPGQLLRQVSPGAYEVNGHTIELPDHQVTNNLRIARQFAAAAVAPQAALRPPLPPKTTPAPATATSSTAAAASRPAAAPSNSLSSGPRLGAGTGRADPETSNRKNVRVDSSGRQYWRDSRGGIRYDF